MLVGAIIWRRLDLPGHDACRLYRSDAGWRLVGTAVFPNEGLPAQLAYHVECDSGWRASQGRVQGWFGADVIDWHMVRSETGIWTLNDAIAPHTESCIDLDFGFTPATNLPQLRRLDLKVGEMADAPAAWLDVFAGTLVHLPQRYVRCTESTYWYEAPSAAYADLIEVDSNGFIRRYPKLWHAER